MTTTASAQSDGNGRPSSDGNDDNDVQHAIDSEPESPSCMLLVEEIHDGPAYGFFWPEHRE